jgi:hypothetical protein
MLDGEDDDFPGLVIDGVIHQIGVTLRHELAYALDLLLPPNMRKTEPGSAAIQEWPHARAAGGFRSRI